MGMPKIVRIVMDTNVDDKYILCADLGKANFIISGDLVPLPLTVKPIVESKATQGIF